MTVNLWRFLFVILISSVKECKPDPEPPGCTFTTYGQVRGSTVSVTLNGRTCQSWNSQSPHTHDRTPKKYRNADLRSNYCRNPDGEAARWCYTADKEVRWEFCEIPLCTISCYDAENKGASYRGTVSTTKKGRTCQRWSSQSPHDHSNEPEDKPNSGLVENYCRNPDAESAPWCYTTDDDKRFEECSIPKCEELGQENCWDPADLGQSYRGYASTTRNGKSCTKWKKHDLGWIENRSSAGLDGFYCRNPDGKASPWCYVSSNDEDWQLCSIPTCNRACTFNPYPSFLPPDQLSKTLSGKTCQAWNAQHPHKHFRSPTWVPDGGMVRNYCRNPNGKPGHWCYTTDPSTRWELCSVPSCTTSCWNYDDRGASYRGVERRTKSGKTCQSWNTQFPHFHSRTPENYPGADLVNNYCRNPDGKDSPWCYTVEQDAVWEYCGIIPCSSDECWDPTDGGKSYRGYVSTTRSNKLCQAWSSQSPHPHPHTADRYPTAGLIKNYCRNLNSKESPWCYTTDSNMEWEHCQIPKCTLDCWDASDGGASYRGTVSKTSGGFSCQDWNVQPIHKHQNIAGNHPGSDLVGNYCRNPTGKQQPWCYTTSSGTEWQYCDIRRC